ncbi:otolin-1-like [Periophthalmus magnuspinnatus]|uniref:otolin-1-like n=1 Tax=Periophthalmus magnuspinnatus TaxID=409849 RepID=UPI00243640EC|nr:otolin-1-like [Periophthalmus magnuspinnatus]
MLLRLLGLMVLCVLCSSMLHFPPETHHNTTDNTKFFNKYGNFSNKGLPAEAQGGVGLGKSLLPSEPSGSTVPEDIAVMFPDTSICDVLLSSSESIYIDQIPLFCLCSHCKTTSGRKGERGDQGFEGYKGSDGPKGLWGFKGPRGLTGPMGMKGQKGELGEKGYPGPIGLLGIKGECGIKGRTSSPSAARCHLCAAKRPSHS